MAAAHLLGFLSISAALVGSILAGDAEPPAAKLVPRGFGDLHTAEQDYLSQYIRSPAGVRGGGGIGQNPFANDQYSLRGFSPVNSGSGYASFYRGYAQLLARLFGVAPSRGGFPSRHFSEDFGSRY